MTVDTRLAALRREVYELEAQAGLGSMRSVVDVLVRDAYRIGFEQRQFTTFVHVAVRHWTADIARKFKLDIDNLHEGLGRPVYALDDPSNPLLPKFLTIHGFKPHSITTDVLGRVVTVFERVYKWEAAAQLIPTP